MKNYVSSCCYATMVNFEWCDCCDHACKGDEPLGYVAWFTWASKKNKTHYQGRCKKCNLFHVWRKRKRVSA